MKIGGAWQLDALSQSGSSQVFRTPQTRLEFVYNRGFLSWR